MDSDGIEAGDRQILHQDSILSRPDFAVGKKTLHDHGFFATPNTAWWTPEDAWMEK